MRGEVDVFAQIGIPFTKCQVSTCIVLDIRVSTILLRFQSFTGYIPVLYNVYLWRLSDRKTVT